MKRRQFTWAAVTLPLLLAACASSTGRSPEEKPEAQDVMILSDEEIEGVVRADSRPLQDLIVVLESLADARAERNQPVTSVALAAALDRVLKINCSDLCEIERKP